MGRENSCICPVIEIRPIRLATGLAVAQSFALLQPGVVGGLATTLNWVNQRLPSGPLVIPLIKLIEFGAGTGRGNSVTCPVGVMRPMKSAAPSSVNHRFPSGPL